jgi:purine-nucleoside phosphorylase
MSLTHGCWWESVDAVALESLAATFRGNAVCCDKARNMPGFTSMYQGRRVSVQGTGIS